MQHFGMQTNSLTTREFVATCSDMMIPVAGSVAYFSVVPLREKESQRLVLDPAAALPPRVTEILPSLRLVLVPYLETAPEGEDAPSMRIAFHPPSNGTRRYVALETVEDANYLFLAVRDDDFFDAHILLYRALAEEIVERAGLDFAAPFYATVDSELLSRAHGEVHERAWNLKRDLLACAEGDSQRPGLLDLYRRRALEETLTLYLHGLCCDLHLEAGPRQLPSRFVRKRLLLLRDQLPPPQDIALFPEEHVD